MSRRKKHKLADLEVGKPLSEAERIQKAIRLGYPVSREMREKVDGKETGKATETKNDSGSTQRPADGGVVVGPEA